MRQAREFAQRPDHGIQRVGDADHEGVRRVFLQALTHGLHDLEVDAQKVVAAHPRLARPAGGEDADIGARDIGVRGGALERRVKALDRAGLGNVQRLALGGAFGDVEQDDVAEFLDGREMGKRAADLACADERDLGSCHGVSPLRVCVTDAGFVSPNRRPTQACRDAAKRLCLVAAGGLR